MGKLRNFTFWSPKKNGLWEHQQIAICTAVAYIHGEKEIPGRQGVTEAALLKLPTASADGHLYFDQSLFHADFSADVPKADARFMAISQVMPAVAVASTPVTQAAWKNKPSWAVISTVDRTINPDLQRYMTKRAGIKTVEIDGSHVAFIARPADVAKVIEQAAAAAAASHD